MYEPTHHPKSLHNNKLVFNVESVYNKQRL